MNSVRNSLDGLVSWYKGLKNRERALVLGAFCALIYVAWHLALGSAQSQRRDALDAELAALTQSMVVLDAEFQVLQGLSARDPLAPQRQELEAIKREIEGAENRLESLAVGLISPRKLPLVMREVLRNQGDVQLLSLETLPPEEILLGQTASDVVPAGSGASETASAPGDAATDLKLYRHGVHLVIQTGYHAAKNYLKVLEDSDWQFYWTSFDYEVVQFPKAIATLNVYTLSANRSDAQK